jgi:hypothetical protein
MTVRGKTILTTVLLGVLGFVSLASIYEQRVGLAFITVMSSNILLHYFASQVIELDSQVETLVKHTVILLDRLSTKEEEDQ